MTNEDRAEQIQRGVNKRENLERLYFDNMGLWHTYIKPYRGLCDYDDLMQEVFIIMCYAAEHYERDKSTFAGFAHLCIRHKIPFYIVSCGRSVGFSMEFSQRLARYRTLKAEGLKDEEILKKMDASAEDLILFERWSDTVGELSVDVASGESLEDAVVDRVGADQARGEVWKICEDRLNERRFDIVRRMFLEGESTVSIAESSGVSQQRINQVKNDALKQLKQVDRLKEIAEDFGILSAYSGCGFHAFISRWGSVEEYIVIQREKTEQKWREFLNRL